MHFRYSDALITQFPLTVGGLIRAVNLNNGPTPEELRERYRTEQQAALDRVGDSPLSELPSLAAWRQAFRQFGVNPTRTRCAPEALLRRLTKQGDVPSINTLVDIGNLVSIRYALPVAIFDTRDVRGTIIVDFANGTERFRELGSDQVIHPEQGEVVFADDTGMVVARRWCWRQGAESAASADTQQAVICIESQHENGLQDTTEGLRDLLELLNLYAGGEYQSAVLSRETGLGFG